MKIRVDDFFINLILVIGVGIPLIFWGVLDTWRTILTILIILVSVIYIFKHGIRKTESSSFLYIYIFVVVGILLFEIFKNRGQYNYSGYEIFYALRQYLWIFFAIPLYYEIIRHNNVELYFCKIFKIVLVSLGLRTFTWFCKKYFGITIFYNLLYEYGNTWERTGKQRVDATALIGILIPILYYMFKKYKKKKYVIFMAFTFFYLVFVSQTRSLLLGALACIGVMFFFEKRSSTTKFILQISIIVCLAIAINFGLIDFIMQKMNLSVNDGAIGYRQYEYAYYSSLLIGGKWRTGIGILTGINETGQKIIFGNLDTPMYLDDLGIFECFLQFGLLSIFLYGALIVYILRVILKCNRANQSGYAFYLIGQLFYIIIVSLPLNLFGIQRCLAVPVILAIACAIDQCVTNEIRGSGYGFRENNKGDTK